MIKTRLTETFVKQLNAIQDYIRDEYQAPYTALRVRKAVEKGIRQLQNSPSLGQQLGLIFPDISSQYQPYQRYKVGTYILIYHLNKAQGILYVDALFHHLQNYQSLFTDNGVKEL